MVRCSDKLCLGKQGDMDVLLTLSRSGYRLTPCTTTTWTCRASRLVSRVCFSHFVSFQTLSRVPKLYTSSVVCPVCSYPNDTHFKFCQKCGYVRQSVGEEILSLRDIREIADSASSEQRYIGKNYDPCNPILPFDDSNCILWRKELNIYTKQITNQTGKPGDSKPLFFGLFFIKAK